MRKRKARCAECGRLTAVSRSGQLHPHNHPGWNTRCACTRPARDTTAAPGPEGQAPLFTAEEGP